MALTTFYVRADAVSGGTGTEDSADAGNPNRSFTFDECLAHYNASGLPAYRYLVKNGVYSRDAASDVFTGDGNHTSPIVMEGFNTTPGDLHDNGWNSDGSLNITNFPRLDYTSGTISFGGANYSIFSCFHVTNQSSAAALSGNTNFSFMDSVKVDYYGSQWGISFNGSGNAVKLDVYSTGSRGIYKSNIGSLLILGSRAKCTGSGGVAIFANAGTIVNCTAYESDIGIQVGTSTANINNCTVVNCTVDGIVVTGNSASKTILGNHITGCTNYGINLSGTVASKQIAYNRFRNNGTDISDSTDDWLLATNYANVTTAGSDADDFTDQPNDNYSLLTTAPGIVGGPGFRVSMGAHGAGSFGGGGIRIPNIRGGADQ